MKTKTRKKKPAQLNLFGYPHVAAERIISEAIAHGGRTYQPCVYCGQALVCVATGSGIIPAWLDAGTSIGDDCPRKGKTR